jgi:aminocarboxymuconate-semialdehyde decarboxylase
MTVIDIHTHMLTLEFLDLLRRHGDKYTLKKTKAGQETVHLYEAPFMTLVPDMWDYGKRIGAMDKAGVDVAIV